MPWDINRCGQKVICIQDHSLWQTFCCDLPCWPLLDQTYTVSGFGQIEGHPGIYLHELSGVTCGCFQLDNAPWPLEIFRSLDQRNTDINELKKLLVKTPERVCAHKGNQKNDDFL